jgi:hypothetical protein
MSNKRKKDWKRNFLVKKNGRAGFVMVKARRGD